MDGIQRILVDVEWSGVGCLILVGTAWRAWELRFHEHQKAGRKKRESDKLKGVGFFGSLLSLVLITKSELEASLNEVGRGIIYNYIRDAKWSILAGIGNGFSCFGFLDYTTGRLKLNVHQKQRNRQVNRHWFLGFLCLWFHPT